MLMTLSTWTMYITRPTVIFPKEMPVEAERYVQKLKEKYPESQWTTLITDPYSRKCPVWCSYRRLSLCCVLRGFQTGKIPVLSNTAISSARFPVGANRDKFLFIGGLSKLNGGDAQGCVAGRDPWSRNILMAVSARWLV